jgi:hypothetical protein
MRGRVVAVAACTLAIAAPVAWLAGEEHRENCLSQQRTSCSVLPWDSGACVKNAADDGTFDLSTPAGRRQKILKNRAERIGRLHCEP